jgi:phage terminase large subunit-like protein
MCNNLLINAQEARERCYVAVPVMACEWQFWLLCDGDGDGVQAAGAVCIPKQNFSGFMLAILSPSPTESTATDRWLSA